MSRMLDEAREAPEAVAHQLRQDRERWRAFGAGLVHREAAVNAFRHANGTRVEIEIEYSPHHVRMLVRDDGRGIDEQVLRAGRDGHWGLSGMRERAQRIGANLKVWSRVGAGTEVEVLVPNHVAFQSRHK